MDAEDTASLAGKYTTARKCCGCFAATEMAI